MSYKVQHFFKEVHGRDHDHYLGKGSSPGGHSSLGIGVSPRPSNPDALFVLKDKNHSFRYPVIR